MKTYREYLTESDENILLQRALHEANDLTPEQDAAINHVVERILAEHANGRDLGEVMEEITNEGFIGSILGGLTGFALGKTIGTTIARILGVEKGVLYDLLTSRLVGAALGSAIGKKF